MYCITKHSIVVYTVTLQSTPESWKPDNCSPRLAFGLERAEAGVCANGQGSLAKIARHALAFGLERAAAGVCARKFARTGRAAWAKIARHAWPLTSNARKREFARTGRAACAKIGRHAWPLASNAAAGVSKIPAGAKLGNLPPALFDLCEVSKNSALTIRLKKSKLNFVVYYTMLYHVVS